MKRLSTQVPDTASTRTLAAIRLLAAGPLRPMKLAEALGITRRSVERLIGRLRAGGIAIVTKRLPPRPGSTSEVGREVTYQIEAQIAKADGGKP